jgi:hypothetical protein
MKETINELRAEFYAQTDKNLTTRKNWQNYAL